MRWWYLTCLVWLPVFGCGGSAHQDRGFRQIELCANPSQPTLLRAGWWKTISGDFQAAKSHFEQAGDHPWSRIGLGYLARLDLDQTRANTILEPLTKHASHAGEIARAWHSAQPSTPWKKAIVVSDQSLDHDAPRLALLRDGYAVLKSPNWTAANRGRTVPQDRYRPHMLGHRRLKVGEQMACLKIKYSDPMQVYIDGQVATAAFGSRTLYELPSHAVQVDIMWVNGEAPVPQVSDLNCSAYKSNPLSFLNASQDWLVQTFIDRETMLIEHQDGALNQLHLVEQPSRSAAFTIQALVSLRNADAMWHALRRRYINIEQTQPPPLLLLQLAIQSHQLKNFTKAWSYLKPLSVQHAEVRPVLLWSIKTLHALQRDEEAKRLSRRYLRLGAPQCKALDIVYGPLGETSANIEQIIASELRCNRLDNAIEKALRWRRLNTAKTILSRLGQSSRDQILRARILSALGQTSQARRIVETIDPVKHLDLDPTVPHDVSVLYERILPVLLTTAPASPTALHMSAWLPNTMPLTTEDHIEIFKDHETARVLRQHRVIRVDESGRGHLVHEEHLRINHVIAARAYAEIGVPEDAHHPIIGIEKPDGTWVKPLDIQEKGTYSLPTLAVGDVIVVRYIRPLNVDKGITNYATPKFRLELPYAPVDVSQITFIEPLELNWRLTSTLDTLSETTVQHESHRTRQVTQTELGRLWQERKGPGLPFNGAFVRWHSEAMSSSHLARQAEVFVGQRSRNFPWARGLCSDGQFDQAKQAALMHTLGVWMHEPSGQRLSPLDLSATLSRCLTQLNVNHKVVLLAPWASQPIKQPLIIDAYSHPVMILDNDLLWDAVGHQTPVGMVPYTLRNTDGLTLYPFNQLSESYQTPSVITQTDQRKIKLTLRKASDDRIVGAVVDTLHGQEAYAMRRYIRDGDQTALTQYTRALMGQFSSLAQFESASITRMEANLFQVQYQFSVAQLEHLQLMSFAQQPATKLAQDLARKTTLFIDKPINQEIAILLDASLGHFKSVEYDERFDDNRFSMAVSANQQQINTVLQIPRQKISADKYDDFKHWCQGVEERESIAIAAEQKQGDR
jgi:hypothetical protein